MSQESLQLTFAKGETIPTEGDTVRMKGMICEYEVKIHEIKQATRHDDETLTLTVRSTRTLAEPRPAVTQYWSLPASEQAKFRR